MTVAVVVLIVVLFVLVLFGISAIKVAREYERAIVFRLGRLFPEPKGPGLFLLIPVIERSSSVNRTGPCATATRMPMLHFPET